MKVLTTFCVVLAGCAPLRRSGARPPADCAAKPPADALPFDSTRSTALVGTFRLVQVITSWSTDSAELSATRSWLSLAPTDSAQRATAGDRRLGRLPRRNLQLIGSWRAAVDTHTYQPAELDAGVLYVGCRDCTDASPDYLHIAAVGPRGFWGTWQNLQTGIGQAIDGRTHKFLPDPGGFFCAWRDAPRPQ